MTRQANYANIVGEIFPAELGAEAKFLRFFQQFLFQAEIAECLAVLVTFRRQRVVIVGAGELNGFQRAFRRGAANAKAIWYGGQAAVPSVRIFSTRKFFSLPGVSSALVS